MPFDIVLVDDHKLVRDGVRTILERGAEFHVVGEAENGADAVQLCKKTAPHLVLMDIGLPGMNGIEATTELPRNTLGKIRKNVLTERYAGLFTAADAMKS